MNGIVLQRIYIYLVKPGDSKINSDEVFVIKDNGPQGGTHGVCFITRDNKSYNFESLGRSADNFLLNQLPEPITYHNYKIQDIYSKKCGSYCLYFFYLIERIKYYNAVLRKFFGQLNMPIVVFGNSSSSHDNGNKIDTSIFVQKHYLRTKYIEANIDMKKQLKIKKSPLLQKSSDGVCKSYVDGGLNDTSIIQNTAHVDFNEENLDIVRFVKVKSLPAVRKQLSPKSYVDEAFSHRVYESSLLRLDRDEKLKLDEQDTINLNSTLTSPKTITETPTKSYVDGLNGNCGNRRDV